MNDIKYPKGEKIWVSYCNASNELMFILTTKPPYNDWYFLYELTDVGFKKLGKSQSPNELEEKFGVRERICA